MTGNNAFVPSLALPGYLCTVKKCINVTVKPAMMWQVPHRSAAALLISAALLAAPPALADDQPLVFDHDQTLSGANFDKRTDLRGAIFSKANCKGASFIGADLSNAQLDDANVRFAFNDAHLIP